MKKSIYILLAAATVLSCSKDKLDTGSDKKGQPIWFNVRNQVELRSSAESADDLIYNASTNPNAHIYIWATKSGSSLVKELATDPVTYEYDYRNKELFYDPVVGLWNISGNQALWECEDGTHNGITYQFSAYAVRGTGDITSVVNSTSSNFGHSFTIVLPATYTYGCGTDYLLSQTTPVTTTWDGSVARGSSVELLMEHALSSIRVKVDVSSFLYKVGIQGIQISGFYRGATMNCDYQAVYGSGQSNRWTMSLPTNNGASYLYGDVTEGNGNTKSTIASCGSDMIISNTDARKKDIMEFIAIPQAPNDAVLTIAYLVQEVNGGPVHQVVSSWDLQDYQPWTSGCRNVYTITINSSNLLFSTVTDWDTGNSVTGVVLP